MDNKLFCAGCLKEFHITTRVRFDARYSLTYTTKEIRRRLINGLYYCYSCFGRYKKTGSTEPSDTFSDTFSIGPSIKIRKFFIKRIHVIKRINPKHQVKKSFKEADVSEVLDYIGFFNDKK